MTKQSTTLIGLVVISSLAMSAGCSKSTTSSSKKETKTISTTQADMLVASGKSTEAANAFTRIGEILLSKPEGIVHAQEMFQKSLELRSIDDKANFYSAILSPVITAKGFVKRFQLPTDTEVDKAQMKALEQKILDSGVKEFIDFALILPEGKKVSKNMEDVRSYLRNEYVVELKNSLVKLDGIKNSKFSLQVDLSKYKNKGIASCSEDVNGAIICQESSSPIQSTFNVDPYDIKALSIILKTQKNAMTLAYSVGLEGFEEIAAKYDKAEFKTDKDVVEAIKSKPNLLKIDGSKEDLREVFDHTEEVMNDLIDFSKISKEICNVESRKSNIASSICVSEAAAEKLSDLLMFVVGPKAVVIGRDQNGEEVTVEVNLRALVESKVKSIQELLPTKFDSAGKAINVPDLTFAGIIPNKDLISKLKTVVR